MTALAEARYEPQVGLAAAAPPLPVALDDSEPATSADEAASLLPHTADASTEPAAKDVSRLRRGFYAYSVASEVFVIVAGTLFLPVVLETYARENGRLLPDYAVACPPSGLGGAAREGVGGDQARCAVRLLGVWIDTASFSLVVYSLSVAAQALVVISMGALADDPHVRHRLLAFFAAVGSLACMLFLLVPSSSSLWPVSALLALLANVAFGASIVCMNAYLPDLGRFDPAVVLAHGSLHTVQRAHLSHRRLSSSSSNTLFSSSQSLARAADAYTTARGRATGALSARAIAAGYAAGITVLLALLPVVRALSGGAGAAHGGTWPLRVAVAVSGLWWLVGTVPAAAWLRPLERNGRSRRRAGKDETLVASVRAGWAGLAEMLREWRRLPQTFVLLASWLILSDAFATITSTAVLFAKTALGLPTSSLILIAILTPLSGLCGALLCPLLQAHNALAHLRLTNHRMLLLLVLASLVVPVWGILALRTAGQMYALSVVFGSLFGAFQSFARASYAQLVPPSRASRFYALYSITDKSSSFLGPALVALVTTATGEIRHGFYLILALMVLAVPVLARVDMVKGAVDAEHMDRALRDEVAAAGEDVLEDEV